MEWIERGDIALASLTSEVRDWCDRAFAAAGAW
jgi:hypothetical protein